MTDDLDDRMEGQAIATRPDIDISAVALRIATSDDPFEVRNCEFDVDAIEDFMRKTGLWRIDEIRPVNETRMRARWKLGRLLPLLPRGKPGPKAKGDKLTESIYLRDALKRLRLDARIALEAERIGTLPEDELDKVFAEKKVGDSLTSYADLYVEARPYWYQANRKQRHRDIAAAALMTLQNAGPFPLIYADPPWRFDIYSEKGMERTPDQHYPTLSDDEIIDFRVGDLTVPQIAHEDAALLLWCTSSNVQRALVVMAGWGFEFKSSAAWVKDKAGLGLVFRNQHEVLLYGTRGDMPGPQYQPKSVFQYPRGRHSAKPPEIRQAIEKMYPDFDARTRLELFSRDATEGWTNYGFEAGSSAAA